MASRDQPRSAPSPFDNPSADLIIRSSDAVDFFVPKVLMALASPVFEDMFIVAQPAPNGQGTHTAPAPAPVVDVTEDSRTLDRLLRFVYPMARPALASLDEALAVAAAAAKYMVDYAAADALAQFAALAEAHALRAYALACTRRNEDAVRAAARVCLLQRAPEATDPAAQELEEACPGALARLRTYHDACGAAASAVVLAYIPTLFRTKAHGRGRMSFLLGAFGVSEEELEERRTKREWWTGPLEHGAAVLRATPHPRVVDSPKFWGRAFAEPAHGKENCDATQDSPDAALLEKFRAEISAKVEVAISEVRLEVIL